MYLRRAFDPGHQPRSLVSCCRRARARTISSSRAAPPGTSWRSSSRWPCEYPRTRNHRYPRAPACAVSSCRMQRLCAISRSSCGPRCELPAPDSFAISPLVSPVLPPISDVFSPPLGFAWKTKLLKLALSIENTLALAVCTLKAGTMRNTSTEVSEGIQINKWMKSCLKTIFLIHRSSKVFKI